MDADDFSGGDIVAAIEDGDTGKALGGGAGAGVVAPRGGDAGNGDVGCDARLHAGVTERAVGAIHP